MSLWCLIFSLRNFPGFEVLLPGFFFFFFPLTMGYLLKIYMREFTITVSFYNFDKGNPFRKYLDLGN